MLGEFHPVVIATASNLIKALQETGDAEFYVLASQTQNVYQRRMAALGADHPFTLDAKETYATWLLHSSETASQGERLQQEVVEGYIRTVGRDDRTTLNAMYVLAKIKDFNNNLDECISLLKEIHQISLMVYGEQDDITVGGEGSFDCDDSEA